MENMVFCQSCALPLHNAEDCGTEADGTKSADYCRYCYQNGAFSSDATMEQMIEICVPFVTGEDKMYKSSEEARAGMAAFFPKLKRWAK